MNSCIRYFGGKGNGLRDKIYKYFPSKLEYSIYIECFGGGGNLLFLKEPGGVEIYNDLEQNVYSLFKVLSDKKLFPKFKEMCDLALYSADIRKEYKDDLKKTNIDIVERAFKYFYINRTSVNSIGGFSTANCVRRNMSKSISDFLSTIDGLPEIHDRLSRVIIENTDGIELIKKFDRKDVFVYADPPYHQSTRTGARYKVDMNDEIQEKLLKMLLGIKRSKILLSGYDCKTYGVLTKNGWNQINIKINTIDGNHKPKEKIETLWYNYDLKNLENSIFEN